MKSFDQMHCSPFQSTPATARPSTKPRPTAKQRWIQSALYFAGAWNLLGGAMALADPASHFAGMYVGRLVLADPLQLFFFRATWINVMAWGAGYLLAAFLPGARIPVLSAGAMGKLAYFAAAMALVQAGVGSTILAVTAAFDVLFAALFALIVWPSVAIRGRS